MKDGITFKEVIKQNFIENKKYYILLWIVLGIGALFCAIQTCRLCNSDIDFDKIYEQERSWLLSEAVSSEVFSGDISIAQVIDGTKEIFHPMQVYNVDTLFIFYTVTIFAIVLCIYILSRHTKNISATMSKRLFAISLICHSVALFGILYWFDSITLSYEKYDYFISLEKGTLLIILFFILILSLLLYVVFLPFKVGYKMIRRKEIKAKGCAIDLLIIFFVFIILVYMSLPLIRRL